MKLRIILLNLLIITAGSAIAGEGMWIPSKIEQGLIEKMRAAGSTLAADQIYSDTKPSIKEYSIAVAPLSSARNLLRPLPISERFSQSSSLPLH